MTNHNKRQVFKFKQFEIAQDQTAMKVGTDGVLLGAWVNLKNGYDILDVGTGTGLIALMCAQRQPKYSIDAVELDKSAYLQALENFNNSKWTNRLNLFKKDFKHFESFRNYDIIISNPPFFDENVPAPDISRNFARHAGNLPLEFLIEKSKSLLKPEGRLNLILPFQKENILKEILFKHQLYLTKICYVKGTPQSKTKRILVEISLTEKPVQQSELIIETKRHEYTDDYISLTKEFYLRM